MIEVKYWAGPLDGKIDRVIIEPEEKMYYVQALYDGTSDAPSLFLKHVYILSEDLSTDKTKVYTYVKN